MGLIRWLPMSRLFVAALARSRESRSRVRRAFDRTIVVLCYHDLRRAEDLDSWLRVDVDAFREHLALLSACGTVISPSAIQSIQDLPGVGPHFVLTFDDGYANWLRLAVPVLEEFGFQALFFASTHHVLTGEPFWFDRVVVALQSTCVSRLDLRRFGLADYSFRAGPPERRWDDIEQLLRDMKRVGNPGSAGFDAVLSHLDFVAQGNTDGDLRPLSVEELRRMAVRDSCQFGSHGHRHEILTRVGRRLMLASFTESKKHLELLTGRRICDIAYPNGDCDGDVTTTCREVGYERGFTAASGLVVWPNVDPYRIPRLLVGGYDSKRRLADRLGGLLLEAIVGPASRRNHRRISKS